MTCERCHGLMVMEQICDYYEIGGDRCFGGCRCLQCGEITDPVILKNRQQVAAANVNKQTTPCLPRLVAA